MAGLPTQLGADANGIDGMAAVVTEAIRDSGDQNGVGGVLGFSLSSCAQIASTTSGLVRSPWPPTQ
jgi:hypothetical protein